MSSTPPCLQLFAISFIKFHGRCVTNTWEGSFIVFVNLLTSLAGVILNSLVCVTIAKNRNLKTNFGFLIFNLSISDLLLSLFVKPMLVSLVIPKIGENCSSSASFLHYTTLALAFTFSASSMATLFLVTLDRYLCVVFPLEYSIIVTRKRTKFVIGVTWLGACVCLIIAFAYPSITESGPGRITVFTGLCVCYVVITLCYSMIYIKIRKQNKVRAEMQSANSSSEDRQTKLALTMALVVTVFTCSWAPLGYILFTAKRQTFGLSTVIWVVTVGLTNSAVNPLVYFFRSRE